MNKRLFSVFIISMFLLIFISGYIVLKKNDFPGEYRTIGTWFGDISVSISYPNKFDSKTFELPEIKADNLYYPVSNWILLNSGNVFEEIDISFNGEMFLVKNNETGHEIERLSIGDNPNINDISMKIFIDKNSTDNDNNISLSKEISGQSFTLNRTLAPGQKINLFFYIKSYNKIISGKYQSLFQTLILSSGSKPVIYDRDFYLTDIKANDFSFNVAFDLIFTSDISIGDIKIFTLKENTLQMMTVSSISPNQSNYHISIPLQTKGNSFIYPFDRYEAPIKLNAANEANTEYINQSLDGYVYSRTTKDWNINVSADNNQLHFVFTRNQERTVFWLLIFTGIILIGLRFLYMIGLKKKIEKTKYMKCIFYIGDVISIPFYFGVIFNYITFTCPQLITIGSIFVIFVLFVSIILGAYIFIKDEENKGKNIIINLKRLRRFNINRFQK